MEILKVFILSLVEGITEFLPVSSTGHMILVNEFVKLEPKYFANIFEIIIQLGAIMSVVVLYFSKLNPFKKDSIEKKNAIKIWSKVIVGFLPAAVLGFLFDEFIDSYLMNSKVVALMLFIWGVLIIFIEKKNKNEVKVDSIEDMDYKTALAIGFMQCFAMIPGTSRSLATIFGGLMLKLSRKTAAEFSFFLAIPTMFGAAGLKVLKIIIKGIEISAYQWFLIGLGMVLSFIVALIVIKKFMQYIKNHSFIAFGIYRIILSILVFSYFIMK